MSNKVPTGDLDRLRRLNIEVWQRQHARRERHDPVRWAYPGEHHKCETGGHGWVWVAVLIVLALLAAGWSGRAEAQTVGLNVATAHDQGGYRSDTPGIYYRAASGLGAGILSNSYGRTGVHAFKTWSLGRAGPLYFSATAGGITGYERAPVVFMGALTMRIGEHHAFHLLPNPVGSSAINYSLEFKL